MVAMQVEVQAGMRFRRTTEGRGCATALLIGKSKRASTAWSVVRVHPLPCLLGFTLRLA